MISFKGVLKYSIYVFIAGWMFLLGIMVGRGNSPVTFDTRHFEDRLHEIAGEFGKKKKELPQNVEPRFYQELKKPIGQETLPAKGSDNTPLKEIKPKPEPEQAVPRKETISLKHKTLNESVKLVETPKAKPKKKTVTKPEEKKAAPKKASIPGLSESGRYLIQVAAYRNFKDAVTRVTELEKKGIKAYREKFETKTKTWYRVRIGFFKSYDDARKYADWLKKAGIKADIHKKDNS